MDKTILKEKLFELASQDRIEEIRVIYKNMDALMLTTIAMDALAVMNRQVQEGNKPRTSTVDKWNIIVEQECMAECKRRGVF